MNAFGIYGSPPQPVKYLFIDAGYLRCVIEDKSRAYFDSDILEIDYRKLTSNFSKTFYYDCLPAQKKGERREDYEERIKPVLAFHEKLHEIGNFHIFLGSTSGEGKSARQKGVDIMIAVHMLMHTFRRNMQSATLLSGDLDFKPLLDALVLDGMNVTLWYEPGSCNKRLINAADSRRHLSLQQLHRLATDEFLQKHPIMTGSSQPKNVPENYKLLEIGKSESVLCIELFENSKHYMAVYLSDTNRGYYHHWSHPSLSFIKQALQDQLGEINWMNPTDFHKSLTEGT